MAARSYGNPYISVSETVKITFVCCLMCGMQCCALGK